QGRRGGRPGRDLIFSFARLPRTNSFTEFALKTLNTGSRSTERMSDICWRWTSRKELTSRKGAHIEFLEEILRELERLGWQKDSRDYFGVLMAGEESLSNA